MTIYAKINQVIVAYEGMTQASIEALHAQQNIVAQFIDEPTYKAEVVKSNANKKPNVP